MLSNQALPGLWSKDDGQNVCKATATLLSLVTFVEWAMSELKTRGSGKDDDE